MYRTRQTKDVVSFKMLKVSKDEDTTRETGPRHCVCGLWPTTISSTGHWHKYIKHLLKLFKKSSFWYWFLEKKEGVGGRTERETSMWERNSHWLPPICAPTRDRTHKLGMCPDWGSKLQPFRVQEVAPNKWATWPGLKLFFFFFKHQEVVIKFWYFLPIPSSALS